MRRVLMTASALALGATAATAGGIERSTQSVGILFEKGNYVELSFGGFNPDVSGSVGGGALLSGDMAASYGSLSFGYKRALTDQLDFALIYDQAIGADVDYPLGTGYPIAGSTAEIDSHTLTALLRYKLPQNISLIGGVRALRTEGTASLLPATAQYELRAGPETDLGYVLGVAWEKPEIAARVALTYNSSITHDFAAQEASVFTGGAFINTTFTTEVPESVNLEFQTGVAKDTLLFGSVRWVDWKAFDITPDHYANGLGQGALVDYTENVTTYTLGLGRKFTENWSGAVILGYEKHTGTPTGNLGPTDGFKSVGLAATYTRDNMKITGGLRYVDIGNATTNPPISGSFKDNSGWGAGIRVGYSF